MTKFLASYGKQLDDSQKKTVLNCANTKNPLFTTTFLNEVRTFGSYENLNKRIEYYIAAPNVQSLFGKIIARMTDDMEVRREE